MTRVHYLALLKAAEDPQTQAEFRQWLRDMEYEALAENKATEQYFLEAFAGGGEARARRTKTDAES
jgi:hypothetical protein